MVLAAGKKFPFARKDGDAIIAGVMSGARRTHKFQIHLMTAIILMFSAGGMIWLNLTEQYRDTDPVTYGDVGTHWGYLEKGWPVTAGRFNAVYLDEKEWIASGGKFAETAAEWRDVKSTTPWYYVKGSGMISQLENTSQIIMQGVLADILTAIVFLITIACTSEFILRRRIQQH